MIFTPSSRALASLEPALSPATTQVVLAETLPATLAPRHKPDLILVKYYLV